MKNAQTIIAFVLVFFLGFSIEYIIGKNRSHISPVKAFMDECVAAQLADQHFATKEVGEAEIAKVRRYCIRLYAVSGRQ